MKDRQASFFADPEAVAVEVRRALAVRIRVEVQGRSDSSQSLPAFSVDEDLDAVVVKAMLDREAGDRPYDTAFANWLYRISTLFRYAPRMIQIAPVTLEARGVRLEPLSVDHERPLAAAAADGRLWELWFTSVPRPGAMGAYIEEALDGQREGHMLAWAVRDVASGDILGTTRYHDIVCAIDRVEIGYTWYAQRAQRTAVNTTCKLLLLAHAFDTLGCRVVGLRTDSFNFRSQRAIERLGAKKDGVIRHSKMRSDGTVRDTVIYSILVGEWFDVRRHLELRLGRHADRSRGGEPG